MIYSKIQANCNMRSAFCEQRLATVYNADTQELVIFYFEKSRFPSTSATYWVTNSIVILITLKFRYYYHELLLTLILLVI